VMMAVARCINGLHEGDRSRCGNGP
jgi:hypothetical protein